MNTPFFFENLTKDLENYQRAIDAHSIVAITDARGVITHVNDKFCDISQYSYAELMGGTHKIINSGYHSRLFFQKIMENHCEREHLARRNLQSCKRWFCVLG